MGGLLLPLAGFVLEVFASVVRDELLELLIMPGCVEPPDDDDDDADDDSVVVEAVMVSGCWTGGCCC